MNYVLGLCIAICSWVSVSCIKIMNTDSTEITLTSNASITITCEDSSPIEWVYPQYEAEESNKNIIEKMENDTYISEFTLNNAYYLDTGYYTCAPKNKTEMKESASIYIYVFDKEHLLAVNDSFMILQQNEFGDVVIPCRPTSPDILPTLVNERDETMNNLTYDPKIGYTLKSPKVTDAGYVTCSARRDSIYSASPSYEILINPSTSEISKPRIDTSDAYHLVEGNNATLNCSVQLTVGINVFINWKCPNEKIKEKAIEGSQTSFNEDYQNGNRIKTDYRTLTITNLTKYDQGYYVCEIEDYNKNKEEESFHLNIHDADMTFLNISAQGDVRELTVKEGHPSVQWIINVTAHPPPNITWFGPNKKEIILGTSFNSKYNVTFKGEITKLAINKIDIWDSGRYELQAFNKYHKDFIDLKLFVEARAVLELKNDLKYYNYENNYSAECIVTGYPLPKVTWLTNVCNNYPICENNTYVPIPTTNYEEINMYQHQLKSIYKFKALETSILSCEAENDFGRSNVTSLFLVSDVEDFSVTKYPNIVAVEEDVILDCGACKYLYNNNITWYFNDSISNELVPLTNITGVTVVNKTTNFSHHSMVNISRIAKNRTGVYVCQVTLSDNPPIKFENKSIFVDVKDIQKPSIISNANKNESFWRIKTGRSIKWDCNVSGIPIPTVRWYKDNNPLHVPQNNRSRIALHNDNQTLGIEFAALGDEGVYSCIAINKAGNATVFYTLILTDKPKDHDHDGFILLCSILTLITVICIMWLAVRIQKERKLRKELAETGLLKFEEGAVESLNPDLGVEDQADLLPYDRRWEFPREKLKFGKQLGSGAFGVVMKAEADGIIDENTTTTVAVKIVKQNADALYIKALASELKIMIHLGRHLNVVNLLGACTRYLNKKELVVIVEYCKYGNLHDFLLKQRNNFVNQIDGSTGYIDFSITTLNKNNQYSTMLNRNNNLNSAEETLIGSDGYLINKDEEPDWRSNYRGDYRNTIVRPIKTSDLICWCFQIARGMDYLASRKVLHGDLAARNVLLADENIVKICDFGLAKSMYASDNYKRKTHQLLPVRWMAIESIRDRVFSIQSDVWAYGITMWELFSLSITPYPGVERLELLYNNLLRGDRLEQPTYATKEIHDIMLDCWHSRPTLRPTFAELSERLGILLEDGVRSHYTNLNEVYLKMNADMNNAVDYLALLNPPVYNSCEEPRYVNLPNRESSDPDEDLELKPMLHNPDKNFVGMNPTCFLNPSYADLKSTKRPTYVNTAVLSIT